MINKQVNNERGRQS